MLIKVNYIPFQQLHAIHQNMITFLMKKLKIVEDTSEEHL